MDEVRILGEWPVILPDYRVAHCAAQPNWEEGRLRSMHAHLRPGMVLYDVGAEHADLSALLATFVEGPGGGVVLVEGSDKFWPVIRATFEANRLVPVACWAGFASDHDTDDEARGPGWGDVSLTVGDEWPTWAGPSLNGAEPPTHHGFKSVVESKDTIPNIRFDTLAEKVGPPDAMTIDVEGAELLVLHGSERILRDVRPLVWVSIHPTLIAHDYNIHGVLGAGDPDFERQRVLDYMASLDYNHQYIETNHEEHALFVPRERTDVDPHAGIEYLR